MAEQKLLKKKHKAKSENNKTLLISVCIDLGELFSRDGRHPEAIAEYKEVSQIYQEQNRPMDYARANRMIGESYTHLREFSKALKYQEVHLQVAREQGDKVEEQRALATIGHTYLTIYLDQVDNPNKKTLQYAYKAFKKSLTICEGLTGIRKKDQMDMLARLLANLGVVEECQGSYDKGVELVLRSINICKANGIPEQLERGYTFLASLYAKKEDYGNAITSYNLAIEVASRLPDKVPLTCASLMSKADILIKIADFQSAKSVLMQAHKLKNPNETERENIEQNLKVVIAMCRTEDALLLTNDTDYRTRKSLYEKMGDGACVLKNYSKGIEYYHKMLECAEKNGDSDKELSVCYISLAETYNDNDQFDEAIEYFKKDYEICKGNAKESISTLFSMIDSMESAKKNFDDIIKVLNQALKECRASGNKQLEGKTLVRYITTLKKHDSTMDVEFLERDLRNLDYTPSESESEVDEPTTQNIGDDIDLDNITDDSAGSGDEKNERASRSVRKRGKAFKITRNAKGETQLHVACINGNAALVEKLITQGHVINVRDNCGWLPIHEACLHGHLSIVQMLVEKGAAINDRGGSLCNGMTPLHDAACNGHLNVIDYLIEKGASIISKNDIGETALHILTNWKKGVSLNSIDQTHYETVVERLTVALEKTGHDKENINTSLKENTAVTSESPPGMKNISQIRNSRKESPLKENEKKTPPSQKRQKIGDLRRNIDNLADDDDIDDFSTKATSEYKSIMDNLRHRSTTSDDFKKRSSTGSMKRPALLEPTDVDDDWLEDDLTINENKRRKTSSENYINSSGSRKSDNSNEIEDDFSEELVEIATSNNSSTRKKRKMQSTLMKAGFTRQRSESPTTTSQKSFSGSNILGHKSQSKITNYSSVIEADSTTGISSSQSLPTSSLVSKTLSIDVRIDGKLFRIPIPVSEMETLTMKWLADEATRRFYKKESMRPTIELETKNGALLSEDDFVSILFPVGGMQSEEVHAKVIKWNIPPIAERYRDACTTLNCRVSDRVLEFLECTTVTLSVPDENLRKDLYPVCRAINRQSNLYELNLGGNSIGDRCVELLCESLPTLDNLAILILSSNNLTYKSLNALSITITQSNNPILSNLYKLDLSYNPLKNESFKFLATLTKSLKLRTLSLCSVDFNSEIFQLFYNKNLELQLEFIEELDLSYNSFNKEILVKFINWLQPINLKLLNVGNNKVLRDGFGKEIIEFLKKNDFGFPNLRVVNFSKCRINDDELQELVSILKCAEQLEELDLSSNLITSSSLKFLLANLPLCHLNVSFCEISSDMDWSPWEFVKADKKCRTLCTTLDYVDNYRECDALVNLWKQEYRDKADIKGLDNGMLRLSVTDYIE